MWAAKEAIRSVLLGQTGELLRKRLVGIILTFHSAAGGLKPIRAGAADSSR